MPARSAPKPAVTPMAFVRAMVAAYRRYGQDPSAALRLARITPAQLRQRDARITAAQMETISGAAMRELDDEALGWFSRRLPWGSYGLLCRGSLGAPDLGVALARWCRHARLLVDDIALRLNVERGRARLVIDERADLGEMREIALVTTLRALHGFACWAIDSRIPLRAVTLPYPAPPHADAYPLMFAGPVAFDGADAELAFDAAYLALPLRRDERALRAMLQRALPLTVLQYRRDRLLAQRVRELLAARGEVLRTAAQLAAELALSVRSLHRQLQEEGTTLQALKDEVRRDRAIEALQRSSRPVKQIALAVGFRNEKAFARAFRQWTGQSPAQCRAGAGSG